MAIVDVTIIPIGTEGTSVSAHVAEVHQVLKQYEGKITYQLTPMSTLIEGELPVLFEVIQAIHEVPFQHGVKRVATNIRIDDRRDKVATMDGKLAAVQGKLAEKTDPAATGEKQTEESGASIQK
ncbi:MTH1187 family thiamine-binding protein [Halalkalibacter oceani]|uniref:MTH1187 family thiamine-binding protein n=1 Tax=Halalkalibacter oceani TaxID=1653776 RepID=UPI0033995909